MRNLFISICTGVLLLSCDKLFGKITTGEEPPDAVVFFDEEEFNRQYQAWNKQSYQNYRFTEYCFFGPNYKNGTAAEHVVIDGVGQLVKYNGEEPKEPKKEDYEDSAEWGYDHSTWELYIKPMEERTIPYYYDRIKQAVEKFRKEADEEGIGSSMYVDYDTKDHFPASYWSTPHEMIGDSPTTAIRDFQLQDD